MRNPDIRVEVDTVDVEFLVQLSNKVVVDGRALVLTNFLLTNRSQSVLIDAYVSAQKTVLTEVLQLSVLGRLFCSFFDVNVRVCNVHLKQKITNVMMT